MLLPIVTMHGTPALLHDWAWPVDGSGIRTMAADLSAVNLRENWDAPAWLPRVHPIAPLLAAASYVVPSAVLLKLFLIATLWLGAFGCYRLARALGAQPLAAVVGACWYAAAPFVADRLVAGHIWMLLAYAAYPLALEAVVSRRSWAHQFFWTACTSIDVHFIGFDALGLLLLLASRVTTLREQRGAWFGLTAFLPSLIAAPFAALSGAFTGQGANDFYNSVNSTPLDRALRGIGYFARYDEAGRTVVQDVALWLPVACAAVAAFWRRRFFAPLLLFAGGILASGTHGPAALLVAWAFHAISAAALYREFFDFVALVCLGGALSIALAPRSRRAAAALAIVAAVAELPQLTGAYGALLHAYSPSESTRAVVARLAQTDGTALVVASPLQPPLAFDAFPGGVDFLAGRVGTHGTIDANHQLEPVARAVVSREQPQRDALLSALGIGFAIERDGWVSLAHDRLEPGFGVRSSGLRGGAIETWSLRTFSPAPFARFRAATLCATGDYTLLDPTRAAVFAGDASSCPGVPLALRAQTTPYPKDGWVEYAPLWFAAPWGAQALPGAIFTTAAAQPFPLPTPCDPDAVYEYRGYTYVNGGRSFDRLVRGCRVQTTVGPAVLDPVVRQTTASRIDVPGGAQVRVTARLASLTAIDGELNAPAFLQLNSRFSRLWLLIGDGGIIAREHVRADGAFNGWRVSGTGHFRAAIVYAPFLILMPLEALLVLAYALALLSMVRAARYHARDVSYTE